MKVSIILLSAFLGYLSFFIILFRKKERCIKCVNIYLSLIMFFGATRLLINSFLFYINSNNSPQLILSDISFVCIGTTSAVFYFLSLIQHKKSYFKKYLIITGAILILFFTLSISYLTNNRDFLILLVLKVALHIYAISCFIYCFYLGYFYLWKIKSNIKAINKRDIIIKNWTKFILCNFLLIVIIRITKFNVLYDLKGYDTVLIAIIWMISFLVIIIKQELLYGFDYLRVIVENVEANQANQANQDIILLPEIWELQKEVQEVSTIKDINLKEFINDKILSYIKKIEHLSFQTQFFRNPSITIDDLSTELKIPKSHLSYLFKFHCNTSFSNYKRLIKIEEAVKLLDTDFIKNNTFEALAIEVGFTSYTSFFTAFKAITGKSPQDYLR